MSETGDITKAIAALAQLNTLAEAVAGYTRVLKEAGVPDAAVTHCVAEYHTFLMQLLGQSMLKQRPKSLLEAVSETAEQMRREGRMP